MRGVRPIRSLLATVLTVVGLAFVPPAAPAFAAPAGSRASGQDACARPTAPDQAACLATIQTDSPSMSSTPPDTRPSGYGPQDIRSAYDLNGRHGGGRTVAITVAFHNPDLESDLAVYRRRFRLPPCTKANGCLRQINQNGGTTPPSGTDSGWALESALDVDAVSAACPDCRILVVESNNNSLSNLLAAVDQAVAQGARFVSNSWAAAGEFPLETLFDHHFSDNPGVAFTFAAGNGGYGTTYPAASPYVTSVGGTTLNPARDRNRRHWTESAWSRTGSGCSLYEPKPPFQHDPLCANRTMNDVSAVADPMTGLAVYNTFGSFGSGWRTVGGTSLSTALVAAMYALAGNPAPGTYPNSYPYARPHAFNDITTGSNGVCGGTYLCTAVPGYDGPTGIGTPHGVTGLSGWSW
ncbi:S8 family serine peptidase [Streptomyces sp. NPDC086787]|uniref:S53 family peptidase n=1 Tax=Streptomyces sp. NPDC086787 TaxID=3365759 RepID=UPI0038188D12